MKNLAIRKELFWDMDADVMDEHIHRVHIVQQVLNLGTLEEFREIIRYYGREGVIDAAKKAGWFDPKTPSKMPHCRDARPCVSTSFSSP